MKDAKTTKFLGSLAILLALLAGYFLVISPFLAERAEAKLAIETAKGNNQVLEARIGQLTRVKEVAPGAQAYDQALSAYFPAQANASQLRNQIYEVAARNGVTATVGTTVPVLVASPAGGSGGGVVEGALPDPVEGDTSEGALPAPSDAGTAPAAGAAAPAAGNDLASIDVTISVTGPRDGVISFLKDLNDIERGLFFTGVSISGDASGENGESYVLDIPAVTYLYRSVPYPTETAQPTDTAEAPATPAEDVNTEG